MAKIEGSQKENPARASFSELELEGADPADDRGPYSGGHTSRRLRANGGTYYALPTTAADSKRETSFVPRARVSRRLILICVLAVLSVAVLFGGVRYASVNVDHPEGPATAVVISELIPAHFQSLDSRRVSIRLGPYVLPHRDINNGRLSMHEPNVAHPFTDGLITAIHADLIFADGTSANIQNGAMLHHMVARYMGRDDTVCPGAQPGQRFFASGNERTPVNFAFGDLVRFGYPISEDHAFDIDIELMNMDPTGEPEVYLKLDLEWVPQSKADGFRSLVPLWLDVGTCDDYNIQVPDDAGSMLELRMQPPWVSTLSGYVVAIGAHFHDGGTHLDILQNDKVVCNCAGRYKQYAPMSEHDVPPSKHINGILACTNVGRIEKGSVWDIRSVYDFSAHAPMRLNDGRLEALMGIGLVYMIKDD